MTVDGGGECEAGKVPRMPNDEVSRDASLARARGGHSDGFDDLVRWLEGPLLGFARARNSDDPDGVVNEVLLRAFSSLGSFSGSADDFRAWVYRIARNLIIDQARARSRRFLEVATAPGDLPPVPVESDDEFDQTSRVAAMLESLTPDQRDVVVLRIIADLSVEQAAQVMGRSSGSVRVLQHRALARLREKSSDDL